MKYMLRLVCLVLLCSFTVAVCAEEQVPQRLVFRSGRVVVGEIVMQNDEVVIVKDASGARFQFPRADIQEITAVEEEQPKADEKESASRAMSNVKKTSMGFRAGSGVMRLNEQTGIAVAADFMIGANNLANRRIFLGGAVGYRALMQAGKTYSVLPIDAVMELPLMTGKHTPMIGAAVGYGIGIGNILGGVNAGLSLAYRLHFSRTGSFHIGVQAEVQQLARFPHSQQVEPGQSFATDSGATALSGMLTLGVLF